MYRPISAVMGGGVCGCESRNASSWDRRPLLLDVNDGSGHPGRLQHLQGLQDDSYLPFLVSGLTSATVAPPRHALERNRCAKPGVSRPRQPDREVARTTHGLLDSFGGSGSPVKHRVCSRARSKPGQQKVRGSVATDTAPGYESSRVSPSTARLVRGNTALASAIICSARDWG